MNVKTANKLLRGVDVLQGALEDLREGVRSVQGMGLSKESRQELAAVMKDCDTIAARVGTIKCSVTVVAKELME